MCFSKQVGVESEFYQILIRIDVVRHCHKNVRYLGEVGSLSIAAKEEGFFEYRRLNF